MFAPIPEVPKVAFNTQDGLANWDTAAKRIATAFG
jgi:hypothetical protein